MTRFGRWFAGALLLAVALFAAALMAPGGSRPAGAPSTPVREASPPPPRTAGLAEGLMVPVAGVRPQDLKDTFGDPRGTEGERGHGALDIMAPRGAPVISATAGTIEKIFDSELGGHTIYVRSPDGQFIYYYAHLDSYAPNTREGVYVARGERLGAVGSSGDADPAGPHLHFEIKRMEPGQPWHEGTEINPYPLLAGRSPGV